MFNAGRYLAAIPRIMRRWFFIASVHAKAYEVLWAPPFRRLIVSALAVQYQIL